MRLHPVTQDLYLLQGREEATEFDEERGSEEKYFSGLVSGGNAFLVNDVDIDVMEEVWLGPERKECGYLLDFDETDDAQVRRVVLQRLVQRGYSVCAWEDYLLFIPLLTRRMEMVEQDLQEIIAHVPVHGEGDAGVQVSRPVLVTTSRQQLAAAREALNGLLARMKIPLDLGEEEAHLWEKLCEALQLERSCLECGEAFPLKTPHDVQCPKCEAKERG
jgi:hypothetical protein